jgi:hypothetical protein
MSAEMWTACGVLVSQAVVGLIGLFVVSVIGMGHFADAIEGGTD